MRLWDDSTALVIQRAGLAVVKSCGPWLKVLGVVRKNQLGRQYTLALPQYDTVLSNLSNDAGIKTSSTSQFCFVCNLANCKFVIFSEIVLTCIKPAFQMVSKKPENMAH